MLATSLTAAVVGVEAHLVRVETDTASGFPKFTMVGLPDAAVKESESRIRAAIRNCGYPFKWDRRITVNLAPAGLRKVGASYDLATAVGLLSADGALPEGRLAATLLVGELALDGSLRSVPGVLPMTLMARAAGLRAVVVPAPNAPEAALVGGIDVYSAATLPEADRPRLGRHEPGSRRLGPARAPRAQRPLRGATWRRSGARPWPAAPSRWRRPGVTTCSFPARRAPAKTMLARRLPGILPPLGPEEALETSAIHSAAGLLREGRLVTRPFRSPHHTSTQAALVGGGSLPRPGEVSLAHNGVLFLDELPEFARHSLESLRQPLEEGCIVLSRIRGSLRLPARFQLVAAMNPCPCGAGGAAAGCRCTPSQARTYARRLSGPLLDRIDLHVEVPRLSYSELSGTEGEPSTLVLARVEASRARQANRSRLLNARLSGPELRQAADPEPAGRALLARAVDQWGLSARAHDRILRVARTLADLEAIERIAAHHVAEALQFRRCGVDTNG